MEQLTKQQEDSFFKKLLSKFTPIEGYKVEDYYGTLTMKFKKNNHYQIKLIYDYKDGKPKTSTPLELKTKDQFFLALRVLEDRSLPERKGIEIDDLFDFTEPKEEKTSKISDTKADF